MLKVPSKFGRNRSTRTRDTTLTIWKNMISEKTHLKYFLRIRVCKYLRLIYHTRTVSYCFNILHITNAKIVEKTGKRFKIHEPKISEIITSSESSLLDNFSNDVLAWLISSFPWNLLFLVHDAWIFSALHSFHYILTRINYTQCSWTTYTSSSNVLIVLLAQRSILNWTRQILWYSFNEILFD